MKKLFRALSGLFGMMVLTLGVMTGIAGTAMPSEYRISPHSSRSVTVMGMTAQIGETTGQTQASMANTSPSGSNLETAGYETELKLFNLIPIKTVHVDVVQEQQVIPCGTPFGIKMFTNGVIIVGTADIDTSGKKANPAAAAGVRIGDIITQINGEDVNENGEVAERMEESDGKPVELTVLRDHKIFTTTLTPVKSSYDNQYKGGLWVRDSTAGIGTVTFYDPEDEVFGGLGHGICDVDTRDLMPMKTGEIVSVTISGVVKGQQGVAGELRGYFTSSEPMGILYANSETGVYGSMEESPVEGDAIPVAMKQEITTGPAKILATVQGDTPSYYDVQIESVNYKEDSDVKNMIVRITDKTLLEKTGGIVQGMSGSPIIQNGKLIGAVTHVFLNDPTQGYGIFAENMLEASHKTETDSLTKAS